jgi:hypothetical protein
MADVSNTSSVVATSKPAGPLASPSGVVSATASAAVLYTFAATLFVSALLLFSVQPLFAKMALPKLGGAPAVWAVSMCFFQAMLLAGYCYAYALIRWLEPRATIAVHATVMLATLVVLPIGLPTSLGEPADGNAYAWLMSVLLAGVGLPFFAVAANAPLLQAWFSRTDHPAARDPYFLYGASNCGSLLALVGYPALIEPWLGLKTQASVWSSGFACLAILLMCSAAWLVVGKTKGTGERTQAAARLDDDVAKVTTHDRLMWTLLALLPSALMVAVTTYITTDLASAPLFWVIPLALFLLTFILVFRERELIPIAIVSRALPILVVALLAVPLPGARLILALAAFVSAALVCHSQLYARRPSASHLTEFYLWMSFGGALGGVFAALLAPQIFVSAFEFTALMTVALFCRPEVTQPLSTHLDARRIVGFGCIAASALLVQQLSLEFGGEWFGRGVMAVILAAVGVCLWLYRAHPAQHAGFMLAIGLFAWMLPASQQAIHTARSFFGVIRVIDTADGTTRLMQHGTTLHGSRRLTDAKGNKLDRPIPATYYHPQGPLARGVTMAREITTGSPNGAIRMGIVGLGTGSMACHTRPGDAMTYFEIDPVVAQIATDARYFDFLSRCRPGVDIVMGDARLTLGRQPNAAFDYLVIDAFTSDAVPAHLLTAEAMTLYMDKLAPHGVLALHVSNRYLELVSAVTATAQTMPGTALRVVEFGGVTGDPDAQPSTVVFLAARPEILTATMTWPDARTPQATTTTPWSDDFSDVLSAIVRHMRR